MFATLCIGLIFTTMAGKAVTGGLISGITSTLKNIKDLKDAWDDLRGEGKKDKKDKETKLSELQKLLKKKPEDLSQKESDRLKELSNDDSLDLENELSPKELQALAKSTGTTISKEPEEGKPEPKSDEPKSRRAELLALIQRDLKEHESDNSLKAREARLDYESLVTCMFDKNGDLLSDKEIDENVGKLPEDVQTRLSENIIKSAKDSKNLEQLKEQIKKISPEEAEAALESAKAKSLEVKEKIELRELFDKEEEELEGIDDETKIREIKDRYDKQREGVKAQYSAKIDEHRSKAEEITKSLENKQIIKAAEEEKANLEKQKNELEGDTDNSKLLKKYTDFEFRDGLNAGSLDDPVNKEKAEGQLKEAGLDAELFRKVQERKSRKGEDGNEPTAEELMNDLGEDIAKDKKRQIENISKKISEKDNVIQNNGEPKKEEPKKEEPKDETNDDETEDETKSSTFADEEPEDDEVDDKGNSKKDPKLVWKRKTYKRGNKTYKTKSYYNKKGSSITADEFKERVKNYSKANESLIDFLKASIKYRFVTENDNLSRFLTM